MSNAKTAFNEAKPPKSSPQTIVYRTNAENRSRQMNMTVESSNVLPGGKSILESTRKATHLNNYKSTHTKVVDLNYKRVRLYLLLLLFFYSFYYYYYSIFIYYYYYY